MALIDKQERAAVLPTSGETKELVTGQEPTQSLNEKVQDVPVEAQQQNFIQKIGAYFVRGGAALKHRNYRLFFFGQLVSLVGTWM